MTTRLARGVTGLVFLTALAVAVTTWIALTHPFDPGQRPAPLIRLDPETARAAARLPDHPGSIVALTYHGVDDHDRPGGTLDRKTFGEHMAALRTAGYRTVRLADVEAVLAGRAVRLPPKALLLTFDDGRLTDWTTVDPVLKVHGFNAVAFLTTARLVAPGTPSRHLSTRQVEALRETGRWEFGSHSHNLDSLTPVPGDVAARMANRILTRGGPETLDQWRARIRADLDRSRRSLRALGIEATAFSYPFGETGSRSNTPQIRNELPALIRAAGFTTAFAGEGVPTEHVDAISRRSPRWTLDRIGVRRTISVTGLLKLLRDAVPIAPPRELTTLPWTGRDAACDARRGTRGELAVRDDRYGGCLLEGVNTSQWTDYRVSTDIAGIHPGTSAIIAVRDGDGAGHAGRVEVVVGTSAAVVRQQIGNGERTVLASAQVPSKARVDPPAGPLTVRITVRGDRLTVQVGKRPPLRARIDRRLDKGGLRFEIATGDHSHTLHFRRPTLEPHPES